MRESTTCTMEKCQWLMPSHVKKIHAARVEDIDFSSPRAKKKKIDDTIANLDDLPNVSSTACIAAPEIVMGSLEHQSFLKDLQINCENSAALMVLKPFADRFQPKSGKGDLPLPLLDLRSEKTLELSFHELLDESQKIVLSLSASQIAAVERETRKQTNSKTWYQQRAGRITASKLKAVLRTPTDKPSSSLIKSICYLEAHKFFSKATRYGCEHEKTAREKYVSIMTKTHADFKVTDSGLQLNGQWPYLGASPDGLVSCSCCGDGVCEIKCPHCIKDSKSIADLSVKKQSCLTERTGKLQLDRGHAYFYQVQCQLNVKGAKYCDFIVWNHNDIFIERIVPDHDLWNSIVHRAESFFRMCILPEILGCAFTDELKFAPNFF